MTSEEKIAVLTEALEFYADPDSYFGVGFLIDPPCGEFVDDFSDDFKFNQYGRPMPGKCARAVLKLIDNKKEGICLLYN